MSMSPSPSIHSGPSKTSIAPLVFTPTTDAAATDGIPANLSMAELMQWLGDTISKTDDLIREQMASMTNAKQSQAAISKALEELNRLQMNDTGDGKDSVDGTSLADGSYKQQDWYKEAGPDGQREIDTLVSKMGLDRPATDAEKITHVFHLSFPIGASIDDHTYTAADGTLMVQGDHKISRDDVKSAIDALTQDLSSMQSSNETNMIKLQSAISSRSQMIEMISNMVHAMDDTAKNVVGNLR